MQRSSAPLMNSAIKGLRGGSVEQNWHPVFSIRKRTKTQQKHIFLPFMMQTYTNYPHLSTTSPDLDDHDWFEHVFCDNHLPISYPPWDFATPATEMATEIHRLFAKKTRRSLFLVKISISTKELLCRCRYMYIYICIYIYIYVLYIYIICKWQSNMANGSVPKRTRQCL